MLLNIGFNAIKSRTYKYERMAKLAMAEHMQTESVFIGTSRTQ